MAVSKLKDLGQFMLGKKPGGPPVPKKELIKLLKRVRDSLNTVIAKLEAGDKPAARKRKPKAKRAK